MKSIIILFFFIISVSLVSCEEVQEVFSIDRCVGEYVCEIEPQTSMMLPSGRTEAPDPPLSNYSEKEMVITVAKTGEYELVLTLVDRVIVAQVGETGILSMPDATIYLENENYTMTLDAKYTTSFISQNTIFIKQEASGEALCHYKGEKFTLTVTNTQTFAGTKK